jgi:hypothetical protein
LKIQKQSHRSLENKGFSDRAPEIEPTIVAIETLRSAQGDCSHTPRGRLHKRTHWVPHLCDVKRKNKPTPRDAPQRTIAKTNPLRDQENEHRSAAARLAFSPLADSALGQKMPTFNL